MMTLILIITILITVAIVSIFAEFLLSTLVVYAISFALERRKVEAPPKPTNIDILRYEYEELKLLRITTPEQQMLIDRYEKVFK